MLWFGSRKGGWKYTNEIAENIEVGVDRSFNHTGVAGIREIQPVSRPFHVNIRCSLAQRRLLINATCKVRQIGLYLCKASIRLVKDQIGLFVLDWLVKGVRWFSL